jgi:spoIIIJ-associated protein
MTEQDASTVVGQDTPAAVETAAPDVSERSADVSERSADVSEDSADVSEHSTDAAASATADVVGEVGSTPKPPSTHRSGLEREGEVAADFLEQLLDIADMDGDIDVDVDGDRAAVAIVDSEEGRVSRRLVGPNGKVLEALQELARLAVQAATGERSRLMLDVAGHRAERRAAVVTVTQAAIAVVRSTNQQVAMEPMTAFERKVVHTEVLAAGLGSESDGVEPQRYVVILPA